MSGSTGRPKGVMLSHRNLLAGARIVTRYLEIGGQDRILSLLRRRHETLILVLHDIALVRLLGADPPPGNFNDRPSQRCRSSQLAAEALGELHDVDRVAATHVFPLTGLGQGLDCELADRLQEPEASFAPLILEPAHEALVDE